MKRTFDISLFRYFVVVMCLRIVYNISVNKKCLGSLMDRTVDSGSTDTGSIPVRDAKKQTLIFQSLFLFKYWESNPGGRRHKHSNAMRRFLSGTPNYLSFNCFKSSISFKTTFWSSTLRPFNMTACAFKPVRTVFPTPPKPLIQRSAANYRVAEQGVLH